MSEHVEKQRNRREDTPTRPRHRDVAGRGLSSTLKCCGRAQTPGRACADGERNADSSRGLAGPGPAAGRGLELHLPPASRG